MDPDRARELLARARADTVAERDRSRQQSLADDRDPAEDQGDAADDLTDRGTETAVAELLTRRLEAIERAERRLAEGTYGRSVRSNVPIPDARLEVEPWAELTVEEQARS
jgi:RNA polymerase-binding transcription factor